MRVLYLVLIVLFAPLSMMSTSPHYQFESKEAVDWKTSATSSALVNASVWSSAGHLLSTSYWHGCSASNQSDHTTCWGKNSAGQHGIGTSNGINTPVESQSLNGQIIDLDTGSSSSYSGFTCAVNSMNELYCWGSNEKGQLGVGDKTPSTTPARVYLDSNLGAVKVSTGFEHACAVATDGTVQCWGWGNDGRLGYGSSLDQLTPTSTSSLGHGRIAVDVSTSWQHSCALLDDGSVVCWGDGGNGKLGNGGTQTKYSP